MLAMFLFVKGNFEMAQMRHVQQSVIALAFLFSSVGTSKILIWSRLMNFIGLFVGESSRYGWFCFVTRF